jgi:hypothetical protein
MLCWRAHGIVYRALEPFPAIGPQLDFLAFDISRSGHSSILTWPHEFHSLCIRFRIDATRRGRAA